jgi:N-acetylmuramoyl-L-alanine amidase
MTRFPAKAKIRDGLLRGVYEQNLVLLGRRSARPRGRRGIPGQRAVLTALFLIAILCGQAIPLSPSVPPPGLGTPAALPGVAEAPAPAAAPPAEGQLADESGAADYHGLARGAPLGIRKVFGLGVKRIMIDPGHGGSAGATGKRGTQEKTVALDIALRLRAALERETGYTIAMTREDDREVSLRSRVQMANESRADLFISVHLNAVPSKPIDIVETYYFGPSKDKQTLELAAEVNEGSEYSYSEYNQVIKEIANELKYQESQRLARSIQDTLYRSMKRRKPDVLDYGVKRAPFMVLLGVEMPAVLVEAACLSNVEEEERLKDPAYREAIADAIKRGIIRYLGDDQKRSGVS